MEARREKYIQRNEKKIVQKEKKVQDLKVS